jgi:hypothetical protein
MRNIGTEGLGVRKDDGIGADHEVWSVLGVRALKTKI